MSDLSGRFSETQVSIEYLNSAWRTFPQTYSAYGKTEAQGSHRVLPPVMHMEVAPRRRT